ncbi:MAG: hypothetical protein HRU70_09910 [Phycisphaeraceae bacterium]|nr:MAG: hypothetical protein HRU70_09910 [Phycisphaeraceae bacterium]
MSTKNMRSTRWLVVFSVAGQAATVNAQSAYMDLRVWDSRAGHGEGAWVDVIDVLPGTRVEAAMLIGFSEGFGLAGAVYQIRGFGGVAADRVDISSHRFLGRQNRFMFGPATQAVYGDGSAWRIDAAGDDGNSRIFGIATTQNSPANGGGFDVSNPALVYRFDIIVAADGTSRTIELEAPLSELKGTTLTSPGVIGVYTSSNSVRSVHVSDVSTDGATIRVVPSPGALALVGLGGRVAGRRRRR